MSKVLDDYGIERDPRFAQCFKEAAAALGVFVLHMAFVLGTVYVLWFHADRDLRVFGLPAGPLFQSVQRDALDAARGRRDRDRGHPDRRPRSRDPRGCEGADSPSRGRRRRDRCCRSRSRRWDSPI